MSFVPKVFRFEVTVVSMLLEPPLFFHQSFVMRTLMMCFCFYFCIIINQSMFEMLPRLMGRNESLLQSRFKTHFHLLAKHKTFKTMKIWWFPCFLLVAVLFIEIAHLLSQQQHHLLEVALEKLFTMLNTI
jgi:hypothetical protein